ncbi:hypothetical protein [Paracraurococcus lichenis]|uniref:Uncharacterized protein n=1 Tax=Paracraurococcus lichenis TaxID=3064888 RepID=A0ABT9EAG3_9PROT|nr:hypothetical protein [Paracraurococcus sp. LOR1-02]MDO9713164.1 hypothetical protein [Paracraurococcus sp. LOR1-02]
MASQPSVFVDHRVRFNLTLICGRDSAGNRTVTEVLHLLRTHLPPASAVRYEVCNFGDMLLGTDIEADGGKTLNETLAEFARQGIPHCLMRSTPHGIDGGSEEAVWIIIASEPDILALAINEFMAVHPGAARA